MKLVNLNPERKSPGLVEEVGWNKRDWPWDLTGGGMFWRAVRSKANQELGVGRRHLKPGKQKVGKLD